MNNTGILSINSDALIYNYNKIKETVGNKTAVAVMLKANAYGIGFKQVFDILYPAGARNFFIAYLDEALALKEYMGDKKANIYVLHDLNEENYSIFLENGFIPVLNNVNNIKLWAEKGNFNKCIVHFDSGIHRLGLLEEDVINNKDLIAKLNIDYVISHFAESEVEKSEYTKEQANKFFSILPYFPKDVKKALCNSSGVFCSKDYHLDMVRIGASIYGINPTPGKENPMKNVITLKSRVIQIKNLKKGSPVGYNRKYVLDKDSTIALIGEGHADTISRAHACKGFVYFNNTHLPIIGNISMDLTAIDVTEVADSISEGDYVEVIGKNVALDLFASYENTIGYETLTLLSSRYKREIV